MPGFVYSNEKPPQLGYFDSTLGDVVLLPFWFVSQNDYSRAEQLIRARFFGSINFWEFRIRVWTYYNDALADSNEPTGGRDMLLYQGSANPYMNVISPTAGITRVALGI